MAISRTETMRCPTCGETAQVRVHEVNSHGAARTTIESYRCPKQCTLDESTILALVDVPDSAAAD
jgi:uncharacterized OB-fold protein